MRVDFLEQPGGFEVGDHALACLESIQAAVLRRHFVVERGIGREDVDHRQRVTLADFVVVEVVRRRDLDAAAAERRIAVVVGDDRHQAAGERQPDLLADEMLVALVGGVYRDGSVAQHRLWTGRRDDQVAAAVRERIAQVPQAAGFGLRDHFEIGQCRVQDRVPVHETLAAIDQSILVQAHEGLEHGLGEACVHREAVTRPVH